MHEIGLHQRPAFLPAVREFEGSRTRTGRQCVADFLEVVRIRGFEAL